MRCPHCNSDNIAQSTAFDLQSTTPKEHRADWECHDCDGWFQIWYRAVVAHKISKGEEKS